jgi:tetratricopeptide (TPR) repeat protein
MSQPSRDRPLPAPPGGPHRKGSRRRALLFAALVAGLAVLLYVGGRDLWAEYHLQAARKALARHELDEARAHLDRCLRARPDGAGVHLLAARTARRTGAFDDAERHLRECGRLGGDPEAVELERILLRVQRGEVVSYGGYLLACVNRDHPDAGLILEALVKGYSATFRLAQAYYCLERWLEREPDNVQALVWRGETAERLRSNGQALEDYQRAVELAPDHVAARLKLAQLLLTQNRTADAVGHFERLWERQPDHAAVRLGLARCRRAQGRPDEARELLEPLLAAEPPDPGALHLRGQVACDLSQFDDAEGWLRRAAAAAPYDRETLYSLQQCLAVVGKQAEARECQARLDKIQAALDRLKELTKQIAASPRDAGLRCEAGRLFLENGQEQEGLRWLESALAEDPGHRPTHATLADYHARHGQAERAALHRRYAGP